MADLSFTAGSVRLFGGQSETMTAGGTVARGNVVRRNATLQAVVASDDSAANAAAYGIALNDAAANQPVTVAILTGGGELEGATFAVGKVYVLSTSGAIAPVDDVAGSEFAPVIGQGVSATRMKLGLINAGVAAAGAVT